MHTQSPTADFYSQEAHRHALLKAARHLVAAHDAGTGNAYFGAVADVLMAAQAMTSRGQGTRPWPKQKDVGRYGDMHPDNHLRVGLDSDNDVYLSVWGNHGADIEFCVPGAGGGKSPRTREALIALMVAIEADNAETPALDFWARRATGATPKHE